MTLRRMLSDIAKAVADQAERDPDFADRLNKILGTNAAVSKATASGTTPRPRNRRNEAVFDPVSVAREGEAALRARLAQLSFEQLKDIVADYRMDAKKLVMKWKDPARILNHIVEVSVSRAAKGDAFRTK